MWVAGIEQRNRTFKGQQVFCAGSSAYCACLEPLFSRRIRPLHPLHVSHASLFASASVCSCQVAEAAGLCGVRPRLVCAGEHPVRIAAAHQDRGVLFLFLFLKVSRKNNTAHPLCALPAPLLAPLLAPLPVPLPAPLPAPLLVLVPLLGALLAVNHARLLACLLAFICSVCWL